MALMFQYGSNCSTDRLNSNDRLRGDARALGWAETVENFALSFDVWSTGNNCAASDLVRGGNEPAQGVLFEVPDYLLSRETARVRNRKSFDQIEGPAYQRVPIRVRNRNGDVMDAITYLVREPARELRTSAEYVGHIVKGLKEHGASADYIEKVKHLAIANNPEIQDAVMRL